MQFASWSYDGLLVNLVAPEGGADLTNYVPVSFFFNLTIYTEVRGKIQYLKSQLL
jgi:hypothetical protein